MRFHHPLVRSATYRAAALSDRRAVHRALAEATDLLTDPDRRAWHAANAATGPDDAVAAELSSGRSCTEQGGVAAAATFLERAARGVGPGPTRVKALAAAQAKRDAAAPEAAHELLAIAELGPLSELQRAQVARMRAQMEFVRSRGGEAGALKTTDAAAQLLSAAKGLESLDDDLARETYLEALVAGMYAGRLGEPGRLAEIANAARAAIDRVPELQRPTDFLLSGMASRIIDGPAVPIPPRSACSSTTTHSRVTANP